MPQQPATSTDRLANVIEVIQLGRKTGVLIAERDTGSMLEQGMIIFVKGQATQANIGLHAGPLAFNILNAWGKCRFTFAPSEGSQITQPLAPVTGEAPTFRDFVTDPTLRIRAATNHKQDNSMPARGQGLNSTWGIQSGSALDEVPYPIRPYNEALAWIERTGLSRAHRRLFLLIDGYRSTPELIRLIGRGQEEVSALLSDLESAGLIRQK